MAKFGQYTKAIAALVTAFYASYQIADADHVITAYEWRTIVIGALVAGALTWALPNSGGPPTPPA